MLKQKLLEAGYITEEDVRRVEIKGRALRAQKEKEQFFALKNRKATKELEEKYEEETK